jgi:arginine decarboxylase
VRPHAASAAWTIDAARALYNVEGWGVGYFDINERGHVIVRPDPARRA